MFLSLLADFSEPQVGVIAQDVRKVLPEAVTSGGRFEMADGRRLDEMLIVNKDRLFLGELHSLIFLTICPLRNSHRFLAHNGREMECA